MAKKGRKSKFLPKYCSQLITHMTNGFSYESFASTIGVGRDTLYRWEKKSSQFQDAKKRGLEAGLKYWETLGLLLANGKVKNGNATVWIFTMKNRFGYKDVNENIHKHTGGSKDDQPIEIVYKTKWGTATPPGPSPGVDGGEKDKPTN